MKICVPPWRFLYRNAAATHHLSLLMDLVATNDLFMPNKLDHLSAVVLHDRQEHKAYANNEYGLVEYTLKPYEIDINYKNKNGERVTATTGYRELYEVLSYMVKVPHYCGKIILSGIKI